MAGSDKTVYQVVRRLNGGVTVLGEVRDSEVSPVRIRETRDPRITLGRVGSFWLVVGEKKEPKLILEATDPSARRTWRPPQMFANIRANPSFELPETVEEFSDPGRHEARSFTSSTQLSVGFSPRDNDFDGVIRQLRSGTLSIPSDVDVTAIEVRAGGWVTTGIKRLKSGLYGFAPGVSIRSVAISSSSNRLDTVRLSDGRVIFVTQPNWSFGEATDLRTPDEIVDAAERWLIRARSALGSTPGSEDDLAEGLRKHLAHTVEADEKADLVASIRLLATRESLQEILPQMMAREPLLQERLKEYELSEKERIRAATRSTVELELESERKRLTAIREDIIEAESRLSVATHRESLLRIESDRLDENIRSKVADAARQVGAMSTERMEQLRSEVEQLKTLVTDLTSSTPQPIIHEQSSSVVQDINAVDDIPQPPITTAATFELSTVEGRGGIIMAVRKACGLSAGEVAAVIAYSTDGVPVFVGQKASGVTVDIVTALGGENAAVAFCDPTRISWQDLLQDETSGLATSVAFAKAHPEILVPIAICNITHGPSEFWIPQFIEARRIGRIPRNLAVFASAGIDGMRVSMSDSALRHLLPVLVPDGAKTVRSLFAGAWPLEVDLDRKRLAEARDWLSEKAGLEGAELDRGSRTLSRIHPSIAMSEASHPFEHQAQWQRALAADGKHEFNQYFKNIEG
jgi:hypothetical protein